MQGNITEIEYYACGYCVNNLQMVFKGHRREKRHFDAGVFLMRHKVHGCILFDTGYTTDIYRCGLIGKLYNLFNPTFVKPEDMIDRQLANDNIHPDDIRYIILSHLHPDHIGGLGKFPHAKVIVSAKAYERYKNPRFMDLIIKQFVPPFFDDNLIVLDDERLKSVNTEFFDACDFFGDGSIMLTNMDGHAYGQLCALVGGDTFLAADTCWGIDLIDKVEAMRPIPRKIQDNFLEYMQVNRLLAKMRDNGIRLLFSHDKYNQKIIR